MYLVIDEMILHDVCEDDIDHELEKAQDLLQVAREQLIALAAAGPHEVLDGEDNRIEWHNHVIRSVNDALELYEDSHRRIFLLEHAKENPDSVKEVLS